MIAQSQGCHPKIFSNKSPAELGTVEIDQDSPKLLQGQPRTRTRPINVHKLCQEINEKLKEEEAQARMGELAAGGCWNCVSMERENYGSVSSHRHSAHHIFDARTVVDLGGP